MPVTTKTAKAPTYYVLKGPMARYAIGGRVFVKNVPQQVTAELRTALSKIKNFREIGDEDRKKLKHSWQGQTQVLQPDIQLPALPASGFPTKQAAIDFAEKYLGAKLSKNKAKKTLESEIRALYQQRLGGLVNASPDFTGDGGEEVIIGSGENETTTDGAGDADGEGGEGAGDGETKE